MTSVTIPTSSLPSVSSSTPSFGIELLSNYYCSYGWVAGGGGTTSSSTTPPPMYAATSTPPASPVLDALLVGAGVLLGIAALAVIVRESVAMFKKQNNHD